jgi:broad specificity phosphatase PhoE
MIKLFLVRHGLPGGEGTDRGLSRVGRAEAGRVADAFGSLVDTRLISSPLRRCRETAELIGATMGAKVEIEPRIGEVIPPRGTPDLQAWLQETFPSGPDPAVFRQWSSVAPELQAWRREVIAAVTALDRDSVVVSHYVAINAIVGAALQSDNTVVCRPKFGSVTELTLDNGVLRLAHGAVPADAGPRG